MQFFNTSQSNRLRKCGHRLTLLLTVFLNSCFLSSRDNSAPAPTPTPAAPVTPPVTEGPGEPPAIDIKALVTTGDGTSFNDQTAGVNDIAINPVSKMPGVIYYDKRANVVSSVATGALRYAELDSSGHWNIEMVDANFGTTACGSAASYCIGAPNGTATVPGLVKLAFKTDGTPAVAYVYGGSLTTTPKELRYAEKVNGAWLVSRPFQSTTAVTTANLEPMKGVTLVFDSQNRPHITFTHYTAAFATSSMVKYLSRSLNSVWTTQDIMSAVSVAPTTPAAGMGINQAGSAICPINDLPLVVTSVIDATTGTSKPFYLQCTAADSTTGACATWSAKNLFTGCAGACLATTPAMAAGTNMGNRADIVIDPATLKPFITLYSTATPNTSLISIRAPNTCATAQPSVSWGAPAVIGATSQGANGFRLATSTSDILVSYLTSTTDIRVNKNVAGAWLASGHIVEAVSYAGEGVGMAYDSTNDLFYTSFASNPAAGTAATGSDIKVAFGAPGDMTSGGAIGTFAYDIIDQLTTVFPNTAIPMMSSAIAPDGTVGYTYTFVENTATNSKLHYGVRIGNKNSPYFASNVVNNSVAAGSATALVGAYPSLAYDGDSQPIIAYYNGNAAEQNLQVAKTSNRGVTWSISTVDDTASDVGQFPSLVVNGSSLAISYYDTTNSGLKLARFTPSTGWKKFLVDGITGAACGVAADNAGRHSALRLTSNLQPVIVYQSNSSLKIAYAPEAITSPTFTWSCASLDGGLNTRGAGIAFELSSSNAPYIAHFDQTAGTIRHVSCAQDIATCMTQYNTLFTNELIETVGSTVEFPTRPSLKISSAGKLFLTYYDANHAALALAERTLSGSTWTKSYIDQVNSGATYTPSVGQYGTLLLNSSNLPMIFFRSNENWLKYFSRENP